VFLSFSKSLCVPKDLIYSAHRKVHYIRRRVAAAEQERERERGKFPGLQDEYHLLQHLSFSSQYAAALSAGWHIIIQDRKALSLL
jgi:hypothetical protein